MAKVQVGVSSPAAIKAAKVKAPAKATGVLGGGFAKTPGKVNKGAMAALNQSAEINNPLLKSTANATPKGGNAAFKAGIKAFGGLPKPMSDKQLNQTIKTNKQHAKNLKNQLSVALNSGGKQTVNESGVVVPASTFHLLGKTGINFGKEVNALPKTTGEGILETGAALGSAALGHPKKLENLGKSIITTDPLVNAGKALVHGNLSGAGNALSNNPLGAVLDVSGVGGVAGKLARTGAVGSKAADLASLEREPIALEGSNFSQSRKFAQSPLFKAAQKKLDEKGVTIKGTKQIEAALKQRAHENVHTGASLKNADLAKVLKTIKSDTPAADIDVTSHLRTGVPTDLNVLRQHLDSEANRFEAASRDPKLSPLERDTNHENVARLRQASRASDEDLQKMLDVSTKHTSAQKELEPEVTRLGITAPSQAEARALMPYAQREMNARLLTKEDNIPTVRSFAAQEDQRVAKELQGTLASLKNGTHPTITDANKELAGLDKQVARARGVRQQLKASGKDTAPADKKIAELTKAKKTAVQNFRTNRKSLISQTKEQYAAARKQANFSKSLINEKLTGLAVPMTKDEEGAVKDFTKPASQQQTPAAVTYRKLSPNEVKERMSANGVNPESASYFSLRPVQEESQRDPFSVGKKSVPKSKKYQGLAYQKGTFAGDTAASAKSLEGTVRAVNQERDWERHINSVAVKNPVTGDVVWDSKKDSAAIKQFTYDYQKQHGIQLVEQPATRLARNENPNAVVLMPKVYLQEVAKYDKQPGPVLSAISKPTQLFRGGVLPFSANYWQGIAQEGLFRSAVHGINPARMLLPGKVSTRTLDSFISKVKSAAADTSLPQEVRSQYIDAANHAKVMLGDGLQLGNQERDLREQLMAPTTNKEGLAKAAAAYRKVEQKVFAPGQAALKIAHTYENHQVAVVANDFLKDMVKVHGSIDAVVKKMSEGDDAANMRADLSQQISKVLGKYTNYGPAEQQFIRSVAPFWPWLANATKFVYVTMPMDHPVLAAVLQSAGQANAQAWQQQHQLPESFMTNLFGTKFGNAGETIGGVDALRNTPYGIGEQDVLQDTSTIAPVEQSAIYGLAGLNPFGDKLDAANGKYGQSMQAFSGGALKNTASQIGSDLIPYYSAGKKLVTGYNGHVAKDSNLSKQPYLRAIENTLAGSLLPKNYSAYNKSSSSSSSSKGFGSGGFSGGGFSSGSGFGGGGF